MPRRVEDIKISDKRSIRDVSLGKSSVSRSETESEKVRVHKVKAPSVVPPPQIPERVTRQKTARRGRRIWAAIIVAIILVVAGTAVISSVYFSRATFTVVPVTAPVNINGVTIVATGTSSPGYLHYEVIKYTGTASTTIPASDGPVTSTKSAGSITLYNSFENKSQRLIAGTRLSSDSGLIYRLNSSVVIPAYTTTNGSINAGTVKVSVTADGAGAQYNLNRGEGTGELRIVAYKGSPKYDTIYARLSTDLTGGFAGTKKTVNPSVLATTTKELQTALEKALMAQASAGIPEGYISYEKAHTMTYTQPLVGGTMAKSASVAETATLYSIVFKKTDLIAKLAGPQKIATFGGGQYATQGLESLQFIITNPGTFNPAKLNTLIARFTGDVKLTGVIPVTDLKHKLAGKPLSDTRAIFGSYSGVIDVPKSTGELFPSWANSVPSDEGRITIEIKD